MSTDPATNDAENRLHAIWTEHLYREYEQINYAYGAGLRPVVIRLKLLSNQWATWDAASRTIAINLELIKRYAWDIVLEVLKHEMAHQLATEVLGAAPSHGSLFQHACTRLGVSEWARRASGELPTHLPEWRRTAVSADEERLLKKVQKLLALAESSNEHEAFSAMQRVQEIYARHNLRRGDCQNSGVMVYVVIGRKRKRIDKIESLICSILLEHYFVQVVYTHRFDAQDLCQYRVIELLGTRANVLMAEYVYYFLWNNVHDLWNTYRATRVTGRAAKQSYMLGVLHGFSDKLRDAQAVANVAVHEGLSHQQTRALIAATGRAVQNYMEERHPRLRSQRGGPTRVDATYFSAGRRDGANITLHKAVEAPTRSRGLRLH